MTHQSECSGDLERRHVTSGGFAMCRSTFTWLAHAAALLAPIGCSDDSNERTADPDAAVTGDGAGAGSEDTDSGAGPDAEPAAALDRSRFSNVGTDAPLDYLIPEMWACRPDLKPNECDSDLTATEIRSDGSRVRVEHEPADAPGFDCFYVYPTVLLDGSPQMVDFSETGVELVNDALLAQGARFSLLCRMFAPLYRQVGLSGGAPVAGADRALGLQDVRDAFAHYLEHWNDGRQFVLIGHSQGTAMLTGLVQQDIDPDERADVRERLISALLIGGGIAVPEGEAVGGTFRNVPICTLPGERGCVIAYASYAADAAPEAGAIFGRAPAAGQRMACVDPAVIAGNDATYSASYFRKGIANPTFAPDDPLPEDLETPFAVYRNLFRGECVEQGDYNYLEITLQPQGDDDGRTPPWRNTAVESIGFGLHLVDYQIPLGDLLRAVAAQAAQ